LFLIRFDPERYAVCLLKSLDGGNTRAAKTSDLLVYGSQQTYFRVRVLLKVGLLLAILLELAVHMFGRAQIFENVGLVLLEPVRPFHGLRCADDCRELLIHFDNFFISCIQHSI